MTTVIAQVFYGSLCPLIHVQQQQNVVLQLYNSVDSWPDNVELATSNSLRLVVGNLRLVQSIQDGNHSDDHFSHHFRDELASCAAAAYSNE